VSAVWPAGLPPATEIDQYRESPPELALRSEMDAGPAKLRRRYSAGPTAWQGTMQLDQAQAALLDTFWRTTLAGGSLAFDWFHPRTTAAVVMRFLGPPQLRHLTGPLWEADLRMEILP
jgi:hypothetical protein